MQLGIEGVEITAFFTVESAAIIQAADTLAIKVPNGIHLNNPAFPNPRPLSRVDATIVSRGHTRHFAKQSKVSHNSPVLFLP